MTVITGYVMAVVAFFVVGGLVGAVAFPLSLPAACAAAFFTWKYFNDKYKKDLDALLNPPAEVWPISMPAAWTALKDVLSVARVETGISGNSNWHITQEDNTRGIIQAQLKFNQALPNSAQPAIVPRAITMSAQLTPEGDGTRAEIHYEIFSPSGTGMVESVIQVTKSSIDYQVAIQKSIAKGA